MLSRENIYTMKLVRRGHPVPKALHANMFLVQSAREVMDRDVPACRPSKRFEEFLLQAENRGASVTLSSPRQPDPRRVAHQHGHSPRLARVRTDVTLGDVAQPELHDRPGRRSWYST